MYTLRSGLKLFLHKNILTYTVHKYDRKHNYNFRDMMALCYQNRYFSKIKMIVTLHAYQAKEDAEDKNYKFHDVPAVQFGFALG